MSQTQGAQGAMAGGGMLSAFGQLAQGAGEAAAYQSNSLAAKKQEEVARQASYIHASAMERAGAEAIGAQQAAFGKAGVAPSLWMLSDTAHRAEMARQLQLYKGRQEAAADEREMDVQHAAATAARTGSYLSAGGTVLGSIAQAAMMGA